MSDNFQENGHIPQPEDLAVERLPADLEAIYTQLTRDGEGWARRLPDASSLQAYPRALADGTAMVATTDSAENGALNLWVSDDPRGAKQETSVERLASTAAMPHARPSRRAVWAGTISTVAIVALLAAAFTLFPHLRGPSNPTTVTATATPQPPSCPADQITADLPPYSVFNKLVMTSPTEGWAIGATTNTTTWQNNPDPLIEHFHQCRWQPIPSPVPGVTASLMDISMDSANDGWAVGTQGSLDATRCLLLHYTEGQWQPSPTPSALPTNAFTTCYAVAMLSPDEGWMLASWSSSGGSTHLFHYTAGAWTLVNMPKTGAYALSAVGTDDVWVAGIHLPFPDLTVPGNASSVDMEHYQRGQWTIFHTAAGPEAPFHMNSPSDGWLASAFLPQLVLHYDGASWQRSAFSDHTPTAYGGIDVIDSDDAWSLTENDEGLQSTLTSIQHYVGGQWQDVSWPFPHTGILSPIIRVAPGDYWTYGEHIYTSDSSVWQTVLLRYVDGTWHEYGA